MSDNKEIEIQVQIKNSVNLFSFLEKEADFIGEKHQIDRYFTPAHKNFIEPRPIKEWLRLRDSSGKFSINYKNWHYDANGKSNYCDEYETPIESLEQMENIISALDIKEVVAVDKIRKLYLYQEYEIAIDSIKDLGDFVEIEFKGNANNRDPAEITGEMVTFLKKIDCGNISRNFVGYPFQLLFPKEVVFEEQ